MMHEQRQYQQQYQPQHHGSQQCQYPAASQQQQPQLYNQDSYLSINESYPGLQKIYDDPPFYLIEEFLSAEECEFLISLSHGHLSTSPVVGAGNGEVSPSRTSSSCYLAREDLPFVVQKVCALTGKPAMHLELPQVGCYLPTQQYLHHYDAFDLTTEDGRRFAQNGGNRVATILVYLNSVERGGYTTFPRLQDLRITPRRGTAALFFPSTLGGVLDPMALHAAEPAVDVKYVSQIWIRQWDYSGVPSRRVSLIDLPRSFGK